MTRWVSESKYVSIDRELLTNVTVYPVGTNKETVKKENPYKRRDVIIPNGEGYRFKEDI